MSLFWQNYGDTPTSRDIHQQKLHIFCKHFYPRENPKPIRSNLCLLRQPSTTDSSIRLVFVWMALRRCHRRGGQAKRAGGCGLRGGGEGGGGAWRGGELQQFVFDHNPSTQERRGYESRHMAPLKWLMLQKTAGRALWRPCNRWANRIFPSNWLPNRRRRCPDFS